MRRVSVSIILGFFALSLTFLAGCGDGDGEVSVSIQVDVSPETATLVTGQTLQITAVVIEGGSSDVLWYVDGILGGDTTVGTVTQSNPTTYTAPAVLPDPATVVVRAVSTQDTTKSDMCTITLTQDIVVDVSPGSGTISTSATFSITADVAGGTTNEIQWYVNDVLSGNVIVGTVTQTNPTTYTAPNSVPSPATVVVKAVSTEDASRYDSCLVTVIEPPDISVDVTPGRQAVEVSETAGIAATVTGGTTGEVLWYVDGIIGGNSTVGTVTQTNPAAYTAPDEIPSPDSVEVVAVSQEDVSESDTCIVTIVMTTIHVNASTGSDETGTGSAFNPVKTITRGLEIADEGETVLVAPGTYDEALGEEFPIRVRYGKKLVGKDWETCIIRGHSEVSAYFPAVILEHTDPVFRKFTVEEGPVVENGWSIAIFLGNNSYGALVDSVRCFERAQYSVLRLEASVNATIQNSVFDVRAISEVDRGQNRGFEIMGNDQGSILRNCTIAGFHNAGTGTGIRMSGDSDALFEGCTIEDNGWGIYLCCHDSEIHNPVPDLGDGARDGTGGNIIRNNDTCGLISFSKETIYARFNTWNSEDPVEGEDYCRGWEGAGDIIVE